MTEAALPKMRPHADNEPRTPASMTSHLDLAPTWQYVADGVMGGVSRGWIYNEVVEGRPAMRLRGRVSLANNGGFIQMAFNLAAHGSVYDAGEWDGIAIDVCGNAQSYDLRLRTDALNRPWESFRVAFIAPYHWTTLYLPFSSFAAHRTDAAFDPARLRRIGLLAVGRAFEADLCVARIGFYR